MSTRIADDGKTATILGLIAIALVALAGCYFYFFLGSVPKIKAVPVTIDDQSVKVNIEKSGVLDKTVYLYAPDGSAVSSIVPAQNGASASSQSGNYAQSELGKTDITQW